MTVRFSDEELIKLRDEFRGHCTDEELWKEQVRLMRKDIKCLHDRMKDYQPTLEMLDRLLPKLDELLTRFSQAKGIFWFIAVAGVSVAALAGAYDWIIKHLRGIP